MSPLPPRPRPTSNDDSFSEQSRNVFEDGNAEKGVSSGLTKPSRGLSITPPAPLAPPEYSTQDLQEEYVDEEVYAEEEAAYESIKPNLDFLPTEQAQGSSLEDLYGNGTIPVPTHQKQEEPEEEKGFRPDYVREEAQVVTQKAEQASTQVKPQAQHSAPPAAIADTYDTSDTYEVEEEEELEDIKRRQQIASLSDSAKENAQRLLALISNDESSEVLLNGPHEIMYKVNGQRFYDRTINFADIEEYHTVINTLILYDTDTSERIGDDLFLIEGQLELPDYEDPNAPSLHARVHVLAPPVVKAAKVTIAKKAKKQFQVEDLAQRGAMNAPMVGFLKALGRGRATIVFSGLSGSGKTTLLEAMSYNFDENDRVIVVEDTAELRLPLADVVPLLATSRKPGQDMSAIVTLEWLVAQANRMRPDRIIVGEIRGGEIAEFLSAANSGADGSMTTVHASSPRQTIDKMLSLAMKSSTAKNESSVLRDISSTVQIIVQMGLIDGKHVITQIEEVSDTVLKNGSGIGTAPIFQYDRNTGRFLSVGRPSDRLLSFLAQRGVNVDNSWFARI
jgi:pilus assembly protein CpaF